MIYLDSSVALAHLLAEDRFPPDLLWDQQLVSSRLLECEVWNRINAYQLQNSHGDAVRNLIGRITMIEMVGPVLARALQPFPVPVRTLDAIHLAALEFIRAQKQSVQQPATTNVYLRQRAFSESQNGARVIEPL
jgi:hypothetical protein